MNVLALASYPVEAAATRYRLEQFVGPLAERGIRLKVRPFLDSRLFASLYKRGKLPRTALGLGWSGLRRLGDVLDVRGADVVLVQREAMMFGPPVIEWLATRLMGRPMILDLDDATYISYTSPTYGRLGSALKWFSKTNDLIRWSSVVTCGNRSIAEYVEGLGGRARIIPTVVDTELFRPRSPLIENDPPVIGWVGTHSTFPYLEMVFPALRELAREHRFRLKVVGAGREHLDLPGVEVQSLDWDLNREIEDFQSFDIGLYPIDVSTYANWAAGKSGFKAIQYMAVGIPYVVTPIAACAEIGEEGLTHLSASTPDQWREHLSALLSDKERRRQMGAAGRLHALEHYTVAAQADKLARALREAAGLSEQEEVSSQQ
ncbi:MAG TPA: glycosyltransferase family 4 protein [Pyrinomonadaceae bacterium]|jgi:glycosyltransferase involved in cell wall biosynthesis